MPIHGVGELNQQGSKILAQLEEDGEPVIITKQGTPIAVLSPLDREQVQDLTLSLAPAFVERRQRAQRELAQGRTSSLDEVTQELVNEAEESAEGQAALAEWRARHPEAGDEARAEDLVFSTQGQALAEETSEVISEIEQLFAEAPNRLANTSAAAVKGWSVAARRLLDGAIALAYESVEQVEKESPSRAESAQGAKAGAGGGD
jgi:prevent-host-death family protein